MKNKKWTNRGLNPRPSQCKWDVIPLHHSPRWIMATGHHQDCRLRYERMADGEDWMLFSAKRVQRHQKGEGLKNGRQHHNGQHGSEHLTTPINVLHTMYCILQYIVWSRLVFLKNVLLARLLAYDRRAASIKSWTSSACSSASWKNNNIHTKNIYALTSNIPWVSYVL